MEKKNKIYRGTASSFGFKKPAVTSNIPTLNSTQTQNQNQVTESVETLITARAGTPRLTRSKKDTNGPAVRPNCFGFRAPTPRTSNKVADSQNNLNSTNTNLRLKTAPQVAEEVRPASRSNLPRPKQQYPVRLATAAQYHRTASADKSAKTAVNNHRRSRSEHGSSASSVNNDADSGVGSQKSAGEFEIIEQLECSPSTRASRLRNSQRSRHLEMIFPTGNEKKFELKELQDTIEVTEIVPLELPSLRLPQGTGLVRDRAKQYTRQVSRDQNSNSSEDDEGIEDEPGEEKLHRDRVLSEKDEKGMLGAGEEGAEGEELWGHGEAMAGDLEDLAPQNLESDTGFSAAMAAPLRSVLLTIEDHSFAALAAMSSSAMLEDEQYPELPDFQSSLSLSVRSHSQSPPKQPEKKNSDSPGSPGTPTHTSNSLSFSSDIRDRDWIDDEICDQPELVYDNLTVTANSAGNTLVADEPSAKLIRPLSALPLSVDCHSQSGAHSSVGTLSPCESITSDDLAMDFDLSAVDDDHRLETSCVEEEGENTISSRLTNRPELTNGVRATRLRVGSSGGESPRSLDTPRLRPASVLSSPHRSLASRQGTSSPGDDISDDSGIRVHRGTYDAMCQDVIDIKTQLIRFRRVLQEAEVVEPSHKNGYYSPAPPDSVQQELISDLQRQVVFLQSQIQERDRQIRSLQSQACQPAPEARSPAAVTTCNAATQTERIRPISTGPILTTQPDAAGGSFVSNSSEPEQSIPRPTSRLPLWRRTELHKPTARRHM